MQDLMHAMQDYEVQLTWNQKVYTAYIFVYFVEQSIN